MRGQSRDELERIAKIRRIKSYEEMSKEDLVVSLLKSKQSIAELCNKIEHNENLLEAENEENDEYLRKLVRILNDKEKHSPYDRDDLNYYGIRDIYLFDK